MLFSAKKPHAAAFPDSPLDIPVADTPRPTGRDISRVRCSFWINVPTACLSLEGKTLALYLLTAPNPSVTPEDVAQRLHISHRKVRHAFAELEQAGLAYRRGKETVVLTGLLAFGTGRAGHGAAPPDQSGRIKNGHRRPGFFPPEF